MSYHDPVFGPGGKGTKRKKRRGEVFVEYGKARHTITLLIG